MRNCDPYIAVKRHALDQELHDCIRKDLPVGRTHTHTHNSVIFLWQSVLRSLNLREETALVLTSRKVTETPKESQPCSVRETMNGETRYAHVPV